MRLLYMGHLPTRGILKIGGKDVTKMSREERIMTRRSVGVVFQDFRLLYHLNVYDNIALPLRLMEQPEHAVKNAVDELVEWVGLKDYRRSSPSTLSGGQQQRIAIARAVIGKPKILLADEPTGNLDDAIGYRILSLFEQLNKMGTTMIIATHNLQMVDRFQHPCIILNRGHVSVQQSATSYSLAQRLQEAQ